jgi:hypothetical protein
MLCPAGSVLEDQAPQQGSEGAPETLNACGYTTKGALLLALQAQDAIAGMVRHWLTLGLPNFCLYVNTCDQLEEQWAED